MSIGINLKKALREREMTVAELSRKSGVSTNTLYAMIRRDSKKVNSDILEKICRNSDITIYELMLDDDAFPFYEYLATDDNSKKEQAEQKILISLNKIDEKLTNFIIESLEDDTMFTDIVNNYGKLNHLGKKEAHKRITELTEIKRYTEKEEPLLNTTDMPPVK